MPLMCLYIIGIFVYFILIIRKHTILLSCARYNTTTEIVETRFIASPFIASPHSSVMNCICDW